MNKSKIETLTFYSKELKKEMSMLVYLLKDYSNMSSLSVLYFLHGRNGDENIMFHIDIESKANKMIENNQINPMIIVCPRFENSLGLNSSQACKEINNSKNNNRIINLGMYENYFIKEVIPLIDKTFNTIKDKNGRYIGGASAGGYIALHNGFKHQNMFSKIGGHMPALEITLDDEDKAYYKDISMWEKYNPIHIAKNNSISNNIKVYLDAGDKDEGQFYKGCSVLHKILKEQGIDSQNYVFPGNHSVEYIKSNIEKYLKFYNE